VLLGLDDAALVVMARRQSPRRAGPPSRTGGRVGLLTVEQFRDDVRISAEHLGHSEPVVEADKRVGDDEAALRQIAARPRE
jgi:hypothetical protein